MSLQSSGSRASRWLRCAGIAAAMALGMLTQSASADTYTWKNVQIVGGGFVPGIIFNETEPGLVYARTDMGGAYRRDPITRCWIPITDWVGWDDWNLTGIFGLATDPVNPNNVYLAAGTYTNDWAHTNGAILKSTDKGATWSISMLPFKLGGNMPGRGSGERLAIDPNNNNVLYFAASGDATTTFGLWKSTNAGSSWSQVSSFTAVGDYCDNPTDPNNYQNHKQGLWWVVFDKRTTINGVSKNIYVGVATKNGPTIYQSTDGGSSWAAVPNQPVSWPGGNTLMPKKAKFDHVNGILYVAYGYQAGPYEDGKGDVYKYNTATGVWTCISPVVNDGSLPSEGNPYFGYNGLDIDRQNPSTIMVTAYSSWWPDTIIWRSTNGGTSWSQIWSWTSYPNRSYRYVANSSGGVNDVTASPWLDFGPKPQSGGRPGPDPHPMLGWMTEGLAIDPFNPNHFMYGTGATIFGCDNLMNWDPNGSGQINLKVMAQGLEETAMSGSSALISPPSGAAILYAGLVDVAGFRFTDLTTVPSTTLGHNPDWSNTTSLDYAELNPGYTIRIGDSSSSSSPVPSSGSLGAYSTDYGVTWSGFGNNPSGMTSGRMAAVNANGTRILWAPEGTGVSVSSNNGTTWTSVPSLPYGTWARPFVCSDRVNPNKFYAFVDRVFYYSTNGGTSFTASAAAPNFPFDRVKIKAVPGYEGDVWAAGGATWDYYGLYHTTDGGQTFTKLANVQEADSVGFGKSITVGGYPAIYISGKVNNVRGIFRSTDAGASWVRINDDAHQYGQFGANCITGDPRVFGRVYVGTNGRGVVYGDINGGATIPTPTAPSALSASAVGTSIVNLNWTDNSSNESAFVIQRATDSGFTQNLFTTSVGSNTATYQFTNLAAGTTYYFRVAAANTGGLSAYTPTASATTQPPVTQPPAAPTNLVAGGITSSSVNLTWVDNANNESGFIVERAKDAAFTVDFASSTAPANATGATAGGLTNITTYYFRVKATNAIGDSAYTNTVSATTKRR